MRLAEKHSPPSIQQMERKSAMLLKVIRSVYLTIIYPAYRLLGKRFCADKTERRAEYKCRL